MIIIVTGGRHYSGRTEVFRALSRLKAEHGILVVYQGACPTGADLWAREWCAENGLPYFGCTPPWERLGIAAGPVRNRYMATYTPATHCLWFPGDRGTANMKEEARKSGMELIEGEALGTPVREITL